MPKCSSIQGMQLITAFFLYNSMHFTINCNSKIVEFDKLLWTWENSLNPFRIWFLVKNLKSLRLIHTQSQISFIEIFKEMIFLFHPFLEISSLNCIPFYIPMTAVSKKYAKTGKKNMKRRLLHTAPDATINPSWKQTHLKRDIYIIKIRVCHICLSGHCLNFSSAQKK